jgi:hypothetical protein
MKTIIFTGIALILIASAFGINDYYKAKKKGEFTKLYHDVPDTVVEKVTSVPIVIPGSGSPAAANDKTDPVVSKMIKENRRRSLRLQDYSRGRIPEPSIEELTPVDSTNPKVEQPVKPEEKIVTEETAPRRISLNQFSRAPLIPERRTVMLVDTTVKLFPKSSPTVFSSLK